MSSVGGIFLIIGAFVSCIQILNVRSQSFWVLSPTTTLVPAGSQIVGYDEVDDKVYLVGGFDPQPINDVFQFDPAVQAVLSFGGLPNTYQSTGTGYASSQVHGSIFFTTYYEPGYLYKFQWGLLDVQLQSVLPVAKDGGSECITINEVDPSDPVLYIVGGAVNTDATSDMVEYHIDTQTFVSLEPLSPPRTQCACEFVEWSDKLYVIGGKSTADYLEDFQSYSLSTGAWSASMTATPRTGAQSVYIPSTKQIFIIGGMTALNIVGEVEIIDTTTDEASSGPMLNIARVRHSVFYSPTQDIIYVTGGITQGNNVLDTIEMLLLSSSVTSAPTSGATASPSDDPTAISLAPVPSPTNVPSEAPTSQWVRALTLSSNIVATAQILGYDELNNVAYVIGGETAASSYPATVLLFDDASMSFSLQSITDNYLSGGNGYATWQNNRIVFFTHRLTPGALYMLSFDDVSLGQGAAQIATLPSMKDMASECITINEEVPNDPYLYILGGKSGGIATSHAVKYSLTQNMFTQIPPMSYPLTDFVCEYVPWKDAVYVGTGITEGAYFTDVMVYSETMSLWNSMNVVIQVPRANARSVYIPEIQQIMIIGGSNAVAVGDVDIIDTYSDIIVPGPPLNIARASHVAWFSPAMGTIFVLGGNDGLLKIDNVETYQVHLPTPSPTAAPTEAPITALPSTAPSDSPTTPLLTLAPSDSPTATPSPTTALTEAPITALPSTAPSDSPTAPLLTLAPSDSPAVSPVVTLAPSHAPSTLGPTDAPSTEPTTVEPTVAHQTEEPEEMSTTSESTTSLIVSVAESGSMRYCVFSVFVLVSFVLLFVFHG